MSKAQDSDVIGFTPSPGSAGLCRVCREEMSVNWREGEPYEYCPEHGETPMYRHCYAVVSGPDRYGHPVLVRFVDDLPGDDLPEGQKIVRARIEYATNGNIRKWDILPNVEDRYEGQ
jgi:hypothetical protein